MAKNKRRTTSQKRRPITAKRVRGSPNLCEVAERIEVAKKEIRDRLRELEEEERESGESAVGSKDREKLEAVLRELYEIIHPIPPVHIWC
jgi:hypothetical protein